MKKFSALLLILSCLIYCARKKEAIKPPIYTETTHIVKKGENFELVLKKLVDQTELCHALTNLLKISGFPFRKCFPGDSINIQRKDAAFSKLTYYQNMTNIFYIFNNNEHLVVAMKFPYIDSQSYFLEGEIKSTLYESILELGENPNLVFRYADVFAWEIDFLTETQEGDSFQISLNKVLCDSAFYEYGNVVYARYHGEVGDFYGVYYMDKDKHEDYYNLKGESLRKSLLKSPLRYSYISSYFAKKRFHPILKTWRPHHGLDYSAPTGTPVSSIGDGIVTFIGWKGGYGNLVEIKHKNNFRTRYGHLSKFAKGLYVNKRVKMGDIVGYVGKTGLATGPHLHFEISQNGAPINPLRVNIPRAPSVKKEYMKDFQQYCAVLLKDIEKLREPKNGIAKNDNRQTNR